MNEFADQVNHRFSEQVSHLDAISFFFFFLRYGHNFCLNVVKLLAEYSVSMELVVLKLTVLSQRQEFSRPLT